MPSFLLKKISERLTKVNKFITKGQSLLYNKTQKNQNFPKALRN
jgi:hypothetical protein